MAPNRVGQRLQKARAALAVALEAAEDEARALLAEGVSEAQVARELGVDRMTVRKWVGKR
jgi:DNA-binding CsgD family transcriptional regulator